MLERILRGLKDLKNNSEQIEYAIKLSYFLNYFAQGLAERNKLRSQALGITSNIKPIALSPKKSMEKENRSNARITEMTKKSQSSPRKSSNNEIVRANTKTLTPSKARTISSKTKDDADVAVEINITSNQNIQVRKRKVPKQ